MTRWWFWLILFPFVLGSAGMLFMPGSEVVENPDFSFYARWGQFIGAAIPMGITGFVFVVSIKFVSRLRRGNS
ncbi:hypothetical protein [Parasedimentitalea marina]|nr:hypothetical protein [Parasedimentitalea marina]